MLSSPLDGVDRVLVGAYTTEMGYPATGVTVMTPDADGSTLTTLSSLPLPSPTYVLTHPSRPWLFTTGEGDPATAGSYRIEPSGELVELSRLQTGGAGACHLSLTDDAAYLLVADYGSGSVTTFAVGDDGVLDGPRDLIEFHGSGPDAERQEGPHAHQTVSLGDELLVCDLGTDRVHRLRLDATGRFSRAADPIRLPPGFGPRHAVVVQDRLVVAGELSSEVWVGARDGDGWVEVQLLPTTAATESPRNPSGIVTDGRTVVVATRGPDTITTYAVEDSVLRQLAEVPCGGHWPRALTLRGSWLWVANERSDSCTVFDLSDPSDPRQVLAVDVLSATCVEILPRLAAEIA